MLHLSHDAKITHENCADPLFDGFLADSEGNAAPCRYSVELRVAGFTPKVI